MSTITFRRLRRCSIEAAGLLASKEVDKVPLICILKDERVSTDTRVEPDSLEADHPI
jgi:hypothetical protein